MTIAIPQNRFRFAPCLLACLVACAAARGQDAVRYSLTPIDSGRADAYVIPRGINERGEVAGTLLLNVGGPRPVLWTPARGTTLLGGFTNPAAGEGLGVAINNGGQVVGTLFDRAALWPAAGARATAVGPDLSMANALNDAGVIVGVEILAGGADNRAFRRLADGTVQYLPDGALPSTVGLAVNASGYAAGLSRTNPFIWAPDGTITPLAGVFEGADFRMAHAINDQNWVVGVQQDRALLWRPGEDPLDLGGLPDGSESVAESLNNTGVVVGSSIVRGLPSAYVWTEETGALPLNDLVDESAEGWVLTNAFDVNDRGQIIGQGIYRDAQRGFLLTPLPEPGAAALLALGAGMLLVRTRRLSPGRDRLRP